MSEDDHDESKLSTKVEDPNLIQPTLRSGRDYLEQQDERLIKESQTSLKTQSKKKKRRHTEFGESLQLHTPSYKTREVSPSSSSPKSKKSKVIAKPQFRCSICSLDFETKEDKNAHDIESHLEAIREQLSYQSKPPPTDGNLQDVPGNAEGHTSAESDNSRQNTDTPVKRPRRIVQPSRILTDPYYTLPSYLPKTRAKRRRPRGDVKTKGLETVTSTGTEKCREDVDYTHKESSEDQANTTRKRKRGVAKTETKDSSFQQIFTRFVHKNQATERNENDQERQKNQFWRFIRGDQSKPRKDDFHGTIEGESPASITISKTEVDERENFNSNSNTKRRGIKKNHINYSSHSTHDSFDNNSQVRNDKDGTDYDPQDGNIKPIGKERTAMEKVGGIGKPSVTDDKPTRNEKPAREKDDKREDKIFYIKRHGIKKNPIDYSSDESVDNVGKVRNDNDGIDYDSKYIQLNRDEEKDGDNIENDGEILNIHVIDNKHIGEERATIVKQDIGNIDDNGSIYCSMNKQTEAGDVVEPNVMNGKPIGKKRAPRETYDISKVGDDEANYSRSDKENEASDVGELMTGKHGKKRATRKKDDISKFGNDEGNYSKNEENEASDVGELMTGKPGKTRATREKDDISKFGDDDGNYSSSDEESEASDIGEIVTGKPGKKRAKREKDDIVHYGDDQSKYSSSDKESKASDVGEIVTGKPGKNRAKKEKDDIVHYGDDKSNYSSSDEGSEASDIGKIVTGKPRKKRAKRETDDIVHYGDDKSNYSSSDEESEASDIGEIVIGKPGKKRAKREKDDIDHYGDDQSNYSSSDEESEASDIGEIVTGKPRTKRAKREKDDIVHYGDDKSNYSSSDEGSEASDVGEIVTGKPGKNRAKKEKDDIVHYGDDKSNYSSSDEGSEASDVGEIGTGKPGKKRAKREKDDIVNYVDDKIKISSSDEGSEASDVGEIMTGKHGKKRATREKDDIVHYGDDKSNYSSSDEGSEASDVGEIVTGKPGKKRAKREKDDIVNYGDDKSNYSSSDEGSEASDVGEIVTGKPGKKRAKKEKGDLVLYGDDQSNYSSSDEGSEASDVGEIVTGKPGKKKVKREKDDIVHYGDDKSKSSSSDEESEASDVVEIVTGKAGKKRAKREKDDTVHYGNDKSKYSSSDEGSEESDVGEILTGKPGKKRAKREKDDIVHYGDDKSNYSSSDEGSEASDVGEIVIGKPGKKRAKREKDDIVNYGDDKSNYSSSDEGSKASNVGEIVTGKPGKKRAKREKDDIAHYGNDKSNYSSSDEGSEASDVGEIVTGKPVKKRTKREKDDIAHYGDDKSNYSSSDEGSKASNVGEIVTGKPGKKRAKQKKDDIVHYGDDQSNYSSSDEGSKASDVGVILTGKPGKKRAKREKDDIVHYGDDKSNYCSSDERRETSDGGKLVTGKHGKKRAKREKDDMVNFGDEEGSSGILDEENEASNVGEFGISNNRNKNGVDPITDEESKTNSKKQKYGNHTLPNRFCLYLTRDEWLSIAPSKSKPSKLCKGWTNIFYDKFHQINKACVLNIKHHHVRKPISRKKNSPYFVAQGVCSHRNCAEYKLTIKDIPRSGNITVSVERIGSIKHTTGVYKKRQCTGNKRAEAKKEVQVTAPSEVYMARLAAMSDTEIQAGNLTECQSRNVLKTISSEGNKTDRLHDDVFLELVTALYLYKDTVSGNKIPGYIQNLSYEPFHAICFLEEQIHVLREACKDRKSILCFDSTGTGIVRPTESKKKIFYFSLVLKNEKGQPPLPIADMLSNSQSMPTITVFLMTVRRALSTIIGGRLPTFPQIETDWSWAMLQSACLAANNMNILEYIKRVFAGYHDDLTPIHICSAHVIHRIAWKCARKTKNKVLKEFLVRFFCTLLVQTSLKGITSYLKSVCRVVLSEKESQEVTKHLKRLTAVGNDAEHDLSEPEINEEHSTHKFKTMRENSPYFSYFKDVLKRERKKVPTTTDGDDNPLFCPWFTDILLKEYLPFVPLWTSMMLRVQEPEGEPRMTNNDIEQWMGQVKNRIWEKRSRIRPLWAIRRLHTSIKGRLRHKTIIARQNEVKLNKHIKLALLKPPQTSESKYLKQTKTQQPVKKSRDPTSEQDITLLEEKWIKKTPRKGNPKYFNKNKHPPVQKAKASSPDQDLKGKWTSKLSRKDRSKDLRKTSAAHNHHDIQSLPWSGFYKRVYVTNTCPLDNFLMAFHLILTKRNDVRDNIKRLEDRISDGAVACKTLLKIHELFAKGQFQRGRYMWLTKVCGMVPEDNLIDVWGTQSERFTNYVVPIQPTFAESVCSSADCPRPRRKLRFKDIILNPPSRAKPVTGIQDMMNACMKEVTTVCNYSIKPSNEDRNVEANKETREVILLDNNTDNSESCKGIRRSTARKFSHGAPPFIIVSVEQVNAQTLSRSSLCDEINVQDNTYELYALTKATPSQQHFVSYMFRWQEGVTYYYDGMDSPRFRRVNKKLNLIRASFAIYVKKKDEVPVNQKVKGVANDITGGTIALRVLNGDIAEAKADVIVNAANCQLQHGGGVAGALSKAAGPILQRESNAWVSNNGEVPVGESVVTGAGTLSAQHIVHAVGPTKEQFKSDPSLLYSAFESALNAASELQARTVAMPLIGTGIFRVDASKAVEALQNAVAKHKEQVTSVKTIDVILNDPEIFAQVKAKLKTP